MWINPSKSLVDRALERWSSTRLRADNTSVVTLMLDPPGPSHVDVSNFFNNFIERDRIYKIYPRILDIIKSEERSTRIK